MAVLFSLPYCFFLLLNVQKMLSQRSFGLHPSFVFYGNFFNSMVLNEFGWDCLGFTVRHIQAITVVKLTQKIKLVHLLNGSDTVVSCGQLNLFANHPCFCTC